MPAGYRLCTHYGIELGSIWYHSEPSEVPDTMNKTLYYSTFLYPWYFWAACFLILSASKLLVTLLKFSKVVKLILIKFVTPFMYLVYLFVFVEIKNPFLIFFQSIRKPMPASTQHPSNLYGASSPVVVSTSPQPLKRYRCAPDAIPR